MKKSVLFSALLFGFLAFKNLCAAPYTVILNPYTKDFDFVNNLASSTIGDLGLITQILNNGTLLGGATWFNFTPPCTASLNGGTATITCAGSGGGGGGALSYFTGNSIITVSTAALPGVFATSLNGMTTFYFSASTFNWTASQTFNSTSTFNGLVYTSSNVLIGGSTNLYNIPLIVGQSTIAPVLQAVTILAEDARAPFGIGRIVSKNSRSGLELVMDAFPGNTGYVGTANSFNLGLLAGNVEVLHVSSGANNDATQVWVQLAGGQGARVGISDETSFIKQPSSMFEVKNGSITNNGNNAGIYVVDPGSVSASAFEARGSSIATQNYTLVYATGGASVGDRMIATQVNGTNIVLGFGKAVTPGSGSGSAASFQNPSTGTLSMGVIGGAGFGIANSTGLEVGQNWQLTTVISTIASAIAGISVGAADNMGSHFATTTLQMNGQAVQGSSQVLVNTTTGSAVVQISSYNASPTWDALQISTGGDRPTYDFRIASVTLSAGTSFFDLGGFVQGSTISAQTQDSFNQTYIARYGPLLRGPSASSLQGGLFPYLYTHSGTISKIGFMNNTADVMEWGINSTPVSFVGNLTNHPFTIRVNDTEVARWDTNGNLRNAIISNPQVLSGYTLYVASGVVIGTMNVYGLISSTGGALLGGTTIQDVFTVSGGSIVLGGNRLVWGPVAPTAGQVPTFNNTNGLVEFKTPTAGQGGGGGSLDVLDPGSGSNNITSTLSVVGPFGSSGITSDGQGGSTITVLMSTNPYRSTSIPAGAWWGCGQSSASKVNGGFPMTSTSTAYNTFGQMYHLFDVPKSTTSFVCTSFRMPYEWDGSSVAFQVSWTSTGLAGRTVDNLMGWSIGGVHFSSGTSIYQTVSSSVTLFSAFSGTNTEIMSPQSASYNIIGGPLPGERIQLVLDAGGGGFTGLPRMTETLMLYHQKYYDGIPR